METLLRRDAAYVQERFVEIQSERRRRHALHKVNVSRPAKLARETVQWGAHDEEESHGEDDCWSSTFWPALQAEKSMEVMKDALEDLTAQYAAEIEAQALERADEVLSTTKTAVAKRDDSSSSAPILDELPPSDQLAFNMFFRICASLKTGGTGSSRLLAMIAPKIPSLLDRLPPIPLTPGVVTRSTKDGHSSSIPESMSVFEELLDIFSGMLESNPCESSHQGDGGPATTMPLNSVDRANVLTAYVSLSLKFGRLRDIVLALRFLLENPACLTTSHVESLRTLLSELADAEPVNPHRQVLLDEPVTTGFLVSFGKGDHGKLGHGQCTHTTCTDGNCTENKTVPTVIGSTREVRFAKIDSLSTHSIAVTTKGEVMAWGNGDKYRLGHGTTTKEYAPRVIDSLSLKGKVSDVACGLGHTLALMSNGDVYAWGNGSNGRLGVGDTNDRSNPTRLVIAEESRPSAEHDEHTKQVQTSSVMIRNVICGASHSLAVTSDGRAFAWGKNNQGQCGHGHTNDQLTPIEIRHFRDELNERVVHVAGGWEHTLFCSASGRVFSCGCGYKDSRRTGIPPVLGHGDCDRRLKPTVVQFFVDSNEEMVRVSCGWDHSLALSAQGALYTWGSGTNGKLGHGDEESCEVPNLVRSLSGKVIKDAKAGCEHTVALTDNHELWTFGQGDSGRLGHGDATTRKLPTMVDFFAHCGLQPVAIAVGDKYNLILADSIGQTNHPVLQSPTRTKNPSVVNRINGNEHWRVGRSRRQARSHGIATRNASVSHFRDLSSILPTGSMNPDCSQINEDSSVDTHPRDQSHVVQHILYHLARLANGYASLHLNDRASSVSAECLPTLLPYGVDTAATALGQIYDVVRLCEIRQSKLNSACTNLRDVNLVCLRLLAVNLMLWPTHRSQDEKMSLLIIGRIRDMVNLITEPKDERDDSNGFKGFDECVREEAIHLLRIGFNTLYSTAHERWNLLQQIVSNAKSREPTEREYLLLSKLCEDSMVRTIILECMRCSTANASHKNFTAALDPHEQSIECSTCGMELIGDLMETLLTICSSGKSNHRSLQNGREALHDLLCVLQAHLFAAIECKSAMVEVEVEVTREVATDQSIDVCERCPRVLEGYLNSLFDKAISIMSETDKVSKHSNPSFLAVVLPHAIEALSVYLSVKSGRTYGRKSNSNEVRICEAFYPKVRTMLQFTDKLALISAESLKISSKSWVIDLGDVTAMLLGQIVSCYILEADVQTLLNQPGGPKKAEEALTFSSKISTERRLKHLVLGFALINESLSELTCSNLRNALILNLAHVIEKLPCILPIVHATSTDTDALIDVIVNLSKLLSSGLASKQLSDRATTTALGFWLWVFRCRLLSGVCLTRLVIETEIVHCIADIQTQTQLNVSNHENTIAEWNHAVDERGSHGSIRLRPIEVLIHANQYQLILRTMARNLFSAIALHVCSLSSLTFTTTHPLIRQEWGIVSTCKFTAKMPQQSIDAPRTIKDTIDFIFKGLLSLLKAATLSMMARRNRVSPLSDWNDNQEEVTYQPSHAFLLASPLCCSSTRSHVLKPLRTRREDPKPSTAISTITTWIFVEGSSLTKRVETAVNTVTTLVALGKPSERIQDSGSTTGAYSPIELTLTDGMSVIIFLTEVCDGLRIGVAVRNSATGDWASVVSISSLRTGRWTHISVTLSPLDPSPCIYIDGKLTRCEGISTVHTVEFGSFTSPTQAVIGGTIGSDLTSMIQKSRTRGNDAQITPRSPAESSAGPHIELMMDDVWVYPARIDEGTANVLFEQGPTIAQLKRDSDVDRDCRSTLILVQKLLELCPVPVGINCSLDGVTDSKPEIVDLLLQVVSETWQGESNELALIAVEQMTRFMPSVELTNDTCAAIIKSLMVYLNDTQSSTNDMRTKFCHFHSLSTRGSVQIAPITTSLQIVVGLLAKSNALQPMSSSLLGGIIDGYARLQERAIVKLIQAMSTSPMWQPSFLSLIVPFISSITSSVKRSDHDKSCLTNALTAVSVISGYCERFFNEIQVRCGYRKSFGAPWSSVLCDDKTIVAIMIPVLVSHYGFDLDSHLLPGGNQGSSNAALELSLSDEEVLAHVQLQCSILRWVLGHMQNSDNSEISKSVREQILCSSAVTEMLSSTASKRISDFIRMRLGPEKKRAQKLASVRLLLTAVSRKSSLPRLLVEDDLEPLTWDVHFRRSAQHQTVFPDPINPLPSWRSPTIHSSPLECLSGDVEICGLAVRSIQHFPTVRLGRVTITVNSGLWYHEVTVLSDGLMQIGYVDADFVPDAVQGQGVGDHANSWAYDGFRRKKWNVNSSEYGEVWQVGDVVGVLLDTDRMELSYFLNGKFLGIAFSNLPMSSTTSLSPAISLNADQHVKFDLGDQSRMSSNTIHEEKSRFQLPSLQSTLDRLRLKPVADALERSVAAESIDDGVDVEDCANKNPSESSDGEGEDNDITPIDTPRTPTSESSSSNYHRSDLTCHAALREPILPGSLHDIERDDKLSSVERAYLVRGCLESDGGKLESGEEEPDQLRRNELVRALVGLGFPLAWAVRCARETRFTQNDTGAVSWILEQMEKEASLSVLSATDSLHAETSAGVEEVQSLNAIRARDDLSLVMAAGRSVFSSENGSWQLSLSPTHNGRPHSEQLSRNRGVTTSPTRLLTSDVTCPSVRTPSTNPFLQPDTDDDDDHNSPEHIGGRGLSGTGKDQGLRRQFIQLHLKCNGSNTTDSAREKATSINSYRRRDDEDLLPASFVCHSILSLAFIRLIIESLLFDPRSDLNLCYPVIAQWATNNPLGLFGYTRTQLQLDVKDISVSYSHNSVALQKIQIRDAFVRVLIHERMHMTGFVLHVAVVDEIRSLVAKGAQDTRRSKLMVESSTAHRELSKNSEWTTWLVVALELSLDGSAAQDPETMFPEGLGRLLEREFTEDVVELAANTHGPYVPWKLAAFRILKLLIFIETFTPEFQPGNTPASLQVQNYVELLAELLRRNQSTRVAFDEPISTIWEIVQCHTRPLSLADPPTAPTKDVALFVEHVSSTNVTISWQYRLQDEEANTSDGGLSMKFQNTILSLDVLPASHLSLTNKIDWQSSAIAGIPHCLPCRGTLAIRHLAPDTCYRIRLTKTCTKMTEGSEEDAEEPIVVHETFVKTSIEPIFELSPDAVGKNLVLSNRNRTVKNLVNKKWHTVRASVGFDEGLHHWHVRIDSCVSKNIFVGVCTVDANLENYVGSDSHGYGFLANKAVWHNKTKIHAYGEIFKQGDLLQVTLDCNAKTLSFSRNGEFLGIAATNLHVTTSSNNGDAGQSSVGSKWYPAFSLYNKDDQLTLIAPPSPPTHLLGGGRPHSQCVSVLDLIESTHYLVHMAGGLGGKNPNILSPPSNERAWQLLREWKDGSLAWREVSLGNILRLDSTRATTKSLFGYAPGDSIFTSRGQCVVLGVHNHELWYEVVDAINSHGGLKATNVASWSLNICREMKNSPDDYPMHRARWREDEDGHCLPPSLQNEVPTTEKLFDFKLQERLDRTLLQLVDAIVLHRGLSTPQHLTYSDLSGALILHDIIEALEAATPNSSMLQPEALLARVAFLFDLNQRAYRVVRMLLHPTYSKARLDEKVSVPLAENSTVDIEFPIVRRSQTDLSARDLLSFVRDHLFESQRERIIAEALRRTVTPTICIPSTDSKSSEVGPTDEGEPKDMSRLKIRLRETLPAPFWRHSSSGTTMNPKWALPSPGDQRSNTLFVQVSVQMEEVNSREWRRQFSSPNDILPVTRTFHLAFVGPPTPSTVEATTEHIFIADQTSQYLKFWDDLFTEIQSPEFPLFVPAENGESDSVQLDINRFLLLPEYAVACIVSTQEALTWYYHLGQLLGMLWRTRVVAPLQFVSLQFWRDLLDEGPTSGSVGDRSSCARNTAIRTVRDGLTSVVPAECLQLSTPASIRNRLSESPLADLDSIQQHAIYDPESPLHAMFWDVARSFSCYERRALLCFLTGRSASHWPPSAPPDDFADDAIEQWKRHIARPSRESQRSVPPLRVELADPLPDTQSHPDACFPVVHVVHARHTRLHLPAYSSTGILRQKLTIAMSSLPLV